MANSYTHLILHRLKQLSSEKRGASTVEYVAIAAVSAAIVGAVLVAMQGGGGAGLSSAVSSAMQRIAISFEPGGGGGGMPGAGGGLGVGGPGSGAADMGIPEAGRPIMGMMELVEGQPGKPRLFSRQWFKTKWDQFLALFKGEEQPQIAAAPEPSGDQAGRLQESGFGALLRGGSTQKALSKEGSVLNVPVLHQKGKNITADSLREGMRNNVNHYKEWGCLPTSTSAVTQYFANQGKGQALSTSEAMNLFYDNHMWNPGDGSSGDDTQFNNVLSGYGLKAKTHYDQADRKIAIENVKQTVQNDTPVITLLGSHPVGRHAVVVTGFKDGKVFYNDSYTGEAGSRDEATFAQWWTYPLDGTNKYPYVVVEPK